MAVTVVGLLAFTACGDDTSGEAAAPVEEPQEEEECLVTEDVEVGDGAEATAGSIVTVHYTGTLEDGTEFDSSRGRAPFKFLLPGQVIQGWNEGIPGMKVGGTRKLTICSDMAYGDTGFPPTIPPGATLIFDVELLKIREG